MKKLVAVLSLFAIGCATGAAKMVKSTKEGGRVMLIGSNSWMEENSKKKAVKEMETKCPKGYEVIEEGIMDRPSSNVGLSQTTHVPEKYFEFKCK